MFDEVNHIRVLFDICDTYTSEYAVCARVCDGSRRFDVLRCTDGDEEIAPDDIAPDEWRDAVVASYIETLGQLANDWAAPEIVTAAAYDDCGNQLWRIGDVVR